VRKVLTPGWLVGHALMLVAVATMLALAAWQLSRATAGNTLSWGYTLQWPVFAGFTVFLWAREARRVLRGEDQTGPAGPGAAAPERTGPVVTRGASGPAEAAYDDSDDPELAAYNRFLAWLSANPGARPVDYPG
jgi:DNA-binding transcriptional regulator of glucitol operon